MLIYAPRLMFTGNDAAKDPAAGVGDRAISCAHHGSSEMAAIISDFL